MVSAASGPLVELRRAASVLDLVRSRGIPAPAYQLVISVDGGTVTVQERLAGRPPAHINRSTIEAVAELTERFASLLVERQMFGRAAFLRRHDIYVGQTLLATAWLSQQATAAASRTGSRVG